MPEPGRKKQARLQAWKKFLLDKEMVRYLILGVLTTLVDFFLVTILREIFGDDHKLVFNSIAVISAIIFSYIGSRLFVFKSKGPILQEFSQFFFSRIGISFVFSNGTIWFLEDVLNFTKKVPLIRLAWSKIIGAALVVTLNYLVGKFLVFRKLKKEI